MTPLDRITIAYALVSLIIVTIRLDSRDLMVPYLCLVPVIAVALAASRTRRGGRPGGFIGEFYPAFLTLALYTEVGMSNRAAGISYDAIVQQWEHAIFGGQPSLLWMSAWPHPAISTLFHLSYLSFYLIVLGTPLMLWFSGRRQAAQQTIFTMMLTFYICYTAFRLFPVAGPRYVFPLQETPAIHSLVPSFAHRLVAGGSAWATAFPSSHVAVAFVNAANAWRAWSRLGLILWIMAVLLALGTVYGQFHYGVDAFAGAVLAAAILTTTRRFQP